MTWTRLLPLARLDDADRVVVKAAWRQITVFRTERGLYACNNRCPHEGYPLKEGSVSGGCVLTCNWHNWKFDLESGKTLVGGDRLRRYPVEVRDRAVWADVSDPPAEEQITHALHQIGASAEKHEYDRMARELARLIRAGGDPLEAVRRAVQSCHHAISGSSSVPVMPRQRPRTGWPSTPTKRKRIGAWWPFRRSLATSRGIPFVSTTTPTLANAASTIPGHCWMPSSPRTTRRHARWYAALSTTAWGSLILSRY